MMRRMPLALVALALAVTLGACAAIPSSGSVRTGGKIDTETQVQGVFQPQGPQPGSKPQDIISDFIQAALDPQNDYKTARQFLTGSKVQKWNPNAGVRIQSGAGSFPDKKPDAQQSYRTTFVASITAAGVYSEEPLTERQPIDIPFTLVKVKVGGSEQWRISDLEDGVIISQSTFDSVFGSYPLYFFSPGYKYLVPDVRWFPTTNSVSTRIASALLAGPTDWLASPVLVTAFPPGTALDSDGVSVDSAIATVALSSEAKQNTSAADRSRMQQQLSASLTSVANVRSVDLTVGGVALAAPVSGAASIVQPSVNPALLVQQKGSFGFATAESVSTIPGISSKAKAQSLVGATYTDTSSVLAGRTAAGPIVYVKSDADAVVVDPIATSVDPSIDSTGFVWYLEGDKLSKLTAWLPGTVQKIDTSSLGLGGNARVISMNVSHDGARLLLYLETVNGPRLIVAGIIRTANNVPLKLGPNPISFPVNATNPIDATWESDRAVATLSGSGSSTSITEFAIGGPSSSLGSVPNATQIVGGNGGATGLRVLDQGGVVYRPSGTGTSWADAGFTATFLATQQPG